MARPAAPPGMGRVGRGSAAAGSVVGRRSHSPTPAASRTVLRPGFQARVRDDAPSIWRRAVATVTVGAGADGLPGRRVEQVGAACRER